MFTESEVRLRRAPVEMSDSVEPVEITMSPLSPIGRYLRELAWETVRQGHTTFTVTFAMFLDGQMGRIRPGFTFIDELVEFCWLAECSYWIVDTKLGKCYSVRVPDFVFYDYHLDRLGQTLNAMESYQ